ncbi:unnamed protein product [Arabidopsis lyrata]|uniref:Uncharacterized protein n=1 Tax=Arabidopsis lyrata subsp. lyrata TaxID=81972 RepID=D7LC61_ARALL|nr:uncharacterized protein LOC9317185 [Arabidopsis lyrata subsp. lyrata]EFH55525.1 hypothetical protein ARALYDRAFT_902041 [Arabidopsis lyrata subsp. lyrata]CAH8264253.1 unnamed protein product [Arabidopsis lyrata]|eukprot:XP_002879266.1 uncharacterized protein LOC9317185 [Arabidopsis lyrata subsp. lyrata]
MKKVDEIEDFRFEDLEMETEKDKERMMPATTRTTRMSYSSSSSPSPSSASSSAASSLAAKAIRASSAHRDSSLSSAYSSPSSAPVPTPPKEVNKAHEYTSMKSLNEPKRGFWGSLASKAKAFLDEDDPNQLPQSPKRTEQNIPSPTTSGTKEAGQTGRKSENPSLQKRLDAITSSLNYIGGTIGTVVEEGITAVENRTAGIIQETRKKIKKKPSLTRNPQNPEIQADLEIQLKASRDVAMAMAAKAKLLLRELKMVKSDLAFAKQRCAQLEEENKVLRENRSGDSQTDDDDLVRLQLETLLAEKARLAHENSIYTRENLYLRGVVEYHQLTMQDVVYFDEKTEEVTEVYPINVSAMSSSSDNSHNPNPSFLEPK